MEKKINKRKYPRKKIVCSVFVGPYKPMLRREEMQKTDLVDISLGGVCFMFAEELPVDKMVILEIELVGWQYFMVKKYKEYARNAKSLNLRVNANIIRAQLTKNGTYKIGAQFINMKAQDQDVLNEYMKQRLNLGFEL